MKNSCIELFAAVESQEGNIRKYSMQGVRLTDHYVEVIRKTFKEYFADEDHLWLFGSRANLSKKGGDIDLYIETTLSDISNITDAKFAFLIELEKQLGEQKIDVVIKYNDQSLLIYDIARKEGVQLV